MNSERRHQLERNELADRLGNSVGAVQPALPYVLGAVAILVVGSIGWGLYTSAAQKKQAVAWTEYYFTLNETEGDSYLDLADEFPNSTAAGWARQTAGDAYLQRGIEAIYRNKSEGVKLIKQSIEAFQGVLNSSPPEELRGKALFGLAQANESLAKVKEATGFYSQFLGTTASPRLISAARERVAFLESEAGKEFYAWFDKQDPKPDSAIELPTDLAVPPTLEGSGLQFGPTESSSDATNGTAPVVPTEIDPTDLPDLPNMEVTPQAESTGELEFPTQSSDEPSPPKSDG